MILFIYLNYTKISKLPLQEIIQDLIKQVEQHIHKDINKKWITILNLQLIN